MVCFVDDNKNNLSIDEVAYNFVSCVNDIVNEANMAILATKYAFICENGYEMPINEAEEKKENILMRAIHYITRKIREFKEKIVKKFKEWKNKLKSKNDDKADDAAEKVQKSEEKVEEKAAEAENNIKEAETPEEVKEEAKKFTEEVKKEVNDTAKVVQKEIATDNQNIDNDMETIRYFHSDWYDDYGDI